MKLLVLMVFIMTIDLSYSHVCLKQTDSLDQEYCFKKALKSLRQSNTKFLYSYKKGIPKKTKASKISSIKTKIANNQSHILYLQEETKLLSTQLIAVEKLKKKKKKKKSNTLLDDLGIKL